MDNVIKFNSGGFEKTSNPDYSRYVALSRYCRWIPEKNRRETWEEVCERVANFWKERYPQFAEDIDKCFDLQKNLEVMGSMRANMTAGPALARDNVAGYNCSFTTISGEGETITFEHEKIDSPVEIHLKNPVDWDELMYILMCGTGVGFSVERQYVNNLPKVGKPLNRRGYLANNKNYPGVPKEEISRIDKQANKIIVHDSKYGWASALRILIFELYNGNFDITWDLSGLRPAGAPLKVFGGRSSGPEPLNNLFEFVKKVFINAEGRKLTSIECHDICCKIAEIVVVGGVRRSALISLSNPTDDRIRRAKTGQWWEENPQRALANNSACYTEKPDFEFFLNEWHALYESKSGERGIFSRVASQRKAAESGRRDPNWDFGTNPCSEIILRPHSFCNLSEVVIRPTDTLKQLEHKVKVATIIGTFQSTLTDFKYLRQAWKKNAEEERLLGVSMTGIMDHPFMSGEIDKLDESWYGNADCRTLPEVLEYLRQVAIDTNKEWAKKLKINQSAAITCVKPSGTVSQLTDTASGIHPRFSQYYIRRVRSDIKDPLTQFLVDQGVPHELDHLSSDVMVFSFPIKSPELSTKVSDVNATKQLELWKIYYDHWCEHKPSITVYYKDEEFLEIGNWLYKNFDDISGVSFLPYSDHSYKQAPYEEIGADEYEKLAASFPKIDWSKFEEYEKEDTTKGSQELACTAGQCEI